MKTGLPRSADHHANRVEGIELPITLAARTSVARRATKQELLIAIIETIAKPDLAMNPGMSYHRQSQVGQQCYILAVGIIG